VSPGMSSIATAGRGCNGAGCERPTEKSSCIPRSNFLQSGYWDPAYDGLLSDERRYVALKQLEATYQESRGYDYEVTKHVLLRQNNPLELLRLQATGTCEFALPEVLFDRIIRVTTGVAPSRWH